MGAGLGDDRSCRRGAAARGLPPRRAPSGRPRRRPDGGVRGLVPRVARHRPLRRHRGRRRHGRPHRAAFGPLRAAQGLRRARLRLLHQRRQPQGRGAARQPAGRAVLRVHPAEPPGARGGRRRAGVGRGGRRLLRLPPPGQPGERLGVGPERARARPGRARGGGRGGRRALRRRRRGPSRGLGRLPRGATEIEFWQGRPDRLHDRFTYLRPAADAPWRLERLQP